MLDWRKSCAARRRGYLAGGWCVMLCASLFGGCGGRVTSSSNGAAGSDSGAAKSNACAPFVACAGDLLGTWEIESHCVGLLELGCETVEYQSIETSGRWHFLTGGSLLRSTVWNLVYTTEWWCEEQACAERERELNAAQPQPPVTSYSSACFGPVGHCSCETSVAGAESVLGDFSVSGARLTVIVDPQKGAYTEYDYCVEGDRLTLRSTALAAGATLRKLNQL